MFYSRFDLVVAILENGVEVERVCPVSFLIKYLDGYVPSHKIGETFVLLKDTERVYHSAYSQPRLEAFNLVSHYVSLFNEISFIEQKHRAATCFLTKKNS